MKISYPAALPIRVIFSLLAGIACAGPLDLRRHSQQRPTPRMASQRSSEPSHDFVQNVDHNCPSSRPIFNHAWKPDLPDFRDHHFQPDENMLQKLPPLVNLLEKSSWPAIYNQGSIGSCTANAVASAFEFLTIKQGKEADFMPSRLFIYYNARKMENKTEFDAGTNIRSGIKSVVDYGVCHERIWPYDNIPADPATRLWPANANGGKTPPDACYDAGITNQAIKYDLIDRNLNHMRATLAQGYPFVFAFYLFGEDAQTSIIKNGVLPMPKSNDQFKGGHAVICVGYTDNKKAFLVRNSWGFDSGFGGNFWIPYDYLMHRTFEKTTNFLANDFWRITVNE